MANKKLINWIKSEEAHGYTKNQLRAYLIRKGYKSKDVDSAIKSSDIKPINFSLKEIFKLTVLKCFFPVLILILIFVSFFC